MCVQNKRCFCAFNQWPLTNLFLDFDAYFPNPGQSSGLAIHIGGIMQPVTGSFTGPQGTISSGQGIGGGSSGHPANPGQSFMTTAHVKGIRQPSGPATGPHRIFSPQSGGGGPGGHGGGAAIMQGIKATKARMIFMVVKFSFSLLSEKK